MAKKENAAVKRFPVEQFFSLRSTIDACPSSDGKSIFFIANTTGIPQVWSIPVNGGWADQLTIWSSAVKSVSSIPKSNGFAFTSDSDGDEQNQIYTLINGNLEHQTEGFEGSQCSLTAFNKAGTKLLFSSNKTLKYNFETYERDLKKGVNKLIKSFDSPYPTVAESWSKDERYIVFVRFYNNIKTDLVLFDTKTNEEIEITKHAVNENVFNANTLFTSDNKYIFYISDDNSDFKGIKIFDVKSQKSEWFIKEKHDIVSLTLNKDGKNLLYSVNVFGSTSIVLFNIKQKKKKKLKLPKGNYTHISFTPDGKRIIFLMDSPEHPNEIYSYEIASAKLKKLSNSLVGGIDNRAFTKPVDHFYTSFDGEKIHSLLYIPKGLKKDGSNPAVVWPHGGPESQEIHNFNRYIQVMSNAGFIVIAPNFRGSTGYGKTFQHKIYKDWGGNEFRDVLAAADELKKTGYVDESKIAVVGGSFGGFMTLTCITKSPEVWKCAVDIFGPSNLLTFINSVPEFWKSGVYLLVGHPENDRKMLEERSPINHADKIKCPLLVIQGKHDPRVVAAESEQIVNKLKSQGKAVEYMLLEDEGHGFTKVSNTIKVFKAKIAFLEKHLKN